MERRRSGNGYAANPISPTDVEAWCRLTGTRLRPWELDILDEMELVRRNFLNRDDKGQTVSNRPMSAELFDGMFV